MTTLIKTLDVKNAHINVITAGRRISLADFSGRIEITEHQSVAPVLEKKIYASFILSEDIDYQTDMLAEDWVIVE